MQSSRDSPALGLFSSMYLGRTSQRHSLRVLVVKAHTRICARGQAQKTSFTLRQISSSPCETPNACGGHKHFKVGPRGQDFSARGCSLSASLRLAVVSPFFSPMVMPSQGKGLGLCQQQGVSRDVPRRNTSFLNDKGWAPSAPRGICNPSFPPARHCGFFLIYFKSF